MPTPDRDPSQYVLSYLGLRRAIGVLGFVLPFVLALGTRVIFGEPFQPTVSEYYYTHTGNVFVGVLFAIGFFLFSYWGPAAADRVTSAIAAAAAVVTALFPTSTDTSTGVDLLIGRIHFTAAALLFAALTYFCLFLFTKSGSNPTPRKLVRNSIFRACGITMAAALVLIPVYYFLIPASLRTALEPWHPVFWLESLMILAFAFSWLVKGELILAD